MMIYYLNFLKEMWTLILCQQLDILILNYDHKYKYFIHFILYIPIKSLYTDRHKINVINKYYWTQFYMHGVSHEVLLYDISIGGGARG
jgi:hypothetical protein